MKKKTISAEKPLILSVSMDTRNGVLTTPSNFFPSSTEKVKKSVFQTNNPVDTKKAVLKTRSEVCRQKPKSFQSKSENEIFSRKKTFFSVNCFFGHVEFNVEKLATFFRSMSENDGEENFFQKFFPQNDPVDM